MNDEEPIYLKIFQKYFNENPVHSPDILKNAFQEVTVYMEKLNHTLSTGNPEEKKKAIHEYEELRKIVKEYVNRYKGDMNISEEEYRKRLNDPKSYKEEDWEVIQESVRDINNIPNLHKNLARETPREREKKTGQKTKKKWLKT